MRLKHEIIKQKRRVNKTVTLIVELNFPKCISQSGDNMLLDETLAGRDRPTPTIRQKSASMLYCYRCLSSRRLCNAMGCLLWREVEGEGG